MNGGVKTLTFGANYVNDPLQTEIRRRVDASMRQGS
jgi:hypothetical protein